MRLPPVEYTSTAACMAPESPVSRTDNLQCDTHNLSKGVKGFSDNIRSKYQVACTQLRHRFAIAFDALQAYQVRHLTEEALAIPYTVCLARSGATIQEQHDKSL